MSLLKYSVFKGIIWSKGGHECGPRSSMADIIIKQMCTLTIKQYTWWRWKPWPGQWCYKLATQYLPHHHQELVDEKAWHRVYSALRETSTTETLILESLEDECCHLGHPLDSTVSQQPCRIKSHTPSQTVKDLRKVYRTTCPQSP